MAFELSPLPYAYDALEPFIDEQTMRIHHDKHHAAYVANLNAAIEKYGDLGGRALDDLLRNLGSVPDGVQTAVRNNGGGHYNHTLFWEIMGPNRGGEPTGRLADAITSAFSDFAGFKDQFQKAAVGRFGSGWAWLIFDKGRLSIESTANQDTPISDGKSAIMGLDVWEHAYYLKYQNRRADYITAWWNVVNWEEIANRYDALKQ